MREPPIPAATIRGSLPPPALASNEPPPDGVTVVPTYKLFTPGQMGLATFLGTPFAGCLLLGRNFGKLRQPLAAWLTYGIGTLVTTLLLYSAIAVPSFPRILSLAGVVAVFVIGKTMQGDAVEQHERAGGPRASWWVAVGLSLLTSLCWVLLAVGAFVAIEFLTMDPSIERNGGEVFHAKGATAAEATAAADALVELEYFDGEPASVRLEREGDRLVALFVVKESAFRDDKVKRMFQAMSGKLSERALGGQPLDIWLTDSVWKRMTSIPWETRTRVISAGKDQVVIRGNTDEEAGKRLVALLQRLRYFEGKGITVTLDRHGRFRVGFVVDATAIDDELVVGYHRFAWRIATHVFEGSPVDIWIVDPAETPLHRLSWDKRPPDPILIAGGHELHRFLECTEDEASATAKLLTSVLAARSGAEVELACEEERIELTIVHDNADTAGVPVEELSRTVFANRPVDLWLFDSERKQVAEQLWEDRPRKKRKK